MKYIVYKTTCVKTNQYYIGFHSTEDPEVFDGYYGSGTGIKELLRLIPKIYFKRETLYVSDNHDDAFIMESHYVSLNINDHLCLNIIKNGGGSSSISKLSKEERTEFSKNRIKNHPNSLPDNLGRKHEGVQLKNIKDGINKTHLDSKWITDGNLEKKIGENESIPDNWKLGRCDRHRDIVKNFTHSDKSKQKIMNSNIGCQVFNNGEKTIRIKKGEKIPDGYTNKGFLKRKKPSNIGNIAYHDPITKKIIRLMPNQAVPDGYVKGTGKFKNKIDKE